MKRASVVLVCLLGVVLIVGAGLLSGVNPLSRGHDSARPPCAQLPDRQAVADAVMKVERRFERVPYDVYMTATQYTAGVQRMDIQVRATGAMNFRGHVRFRSSRA